MRKGESGNEIVQSLPSNQTTLSLSIVEKKNLMRKVMRSLSHTQEEKVSFFPFKRAKNSKILVLLNLTFFKKREKQAALNALFRKKIQGEFGQKKK